MTPGFDFLFSFFGRFGIRLYILKSKSLSPEAKLPFQKLLNQVQNRYGWNSKYETAGTANIGQVLIPSISNHFFYHTLRQLGQYNSQSSHFSKGFLELCC